MGSMRSTTEASEESKGHYKVLSYRSSWAGLYWRVPSILKHMCFRNPDKWRSVGVFVCCCFGMRRSVEGFELLSSGRPARKSPCVS